MIPVLKTPLFSRKLIGVFSSSSSYSSFIRFFCISRRASASRRKPKGLNEKYGNIGKNWNYSDGSVHSGGLKEQNCHVSRHERGDVLFVSVEARRIRHSRASAWLASIQGWLRRSFKAFVRV